MKKYIPILDWLPNYKKKNLSGDLSAGITVGVMLIPQGMAYAMLAGLKPIYGLYAATVPLILYAIFGTSRQLAVGPVAVVSLLIASGVGALAEIGSDSFLGMAILLSLMIGVFQLIMGIFKVGFIVNFLSHPVLSGFISAAAVYIAFSQMKHVLGISIPRGKVHETAYNIYLKFGEINKYTLAVGLGGIVTIIVLKKINKRIPFPLVVVLLGMGVGYALGLDAMPYNVSIVGDVPDGLPSFTVPTVTYEAVTSLLPIALTIALIGFTESIAVAKSIQKKHKNYEIDASQELLALGIANIGASFFQAFPTMGGFARSAVNDQSGAKTNLAGIISATVVILTLLFLTPYFYYLPNAILASIIIVAVFGLIDFKEAKHLWKTDRRDFAMFIITAIATLTLGVEQGIMVGVGVSIVGLILRVSYPHMAELGLDEQSRKYLNVERFEHINPADEILIVRLDAQLFFANTRYFLDKLKSLEEKRGDIKAVIIDASGVNGMDSSAVHAISDLVEDYQKRNIRFLMTSVKGPVRDILRRTVLRNKIGEDNFFLSIDDALTYLETNTQKEYKDITLQTNED
ncbi:MAG: solute carrier family 26 protein [Crocinitomix sp.]|nr:solute carrier family 26 protein [Crocinitomix sp.]